MATNPFKPHINGTTYGWGMVQVFLQGDTTPIATVRNVEYSDNQDIENIYAGGVMPAGRGYGNYEATAKITLLQEGVIALQRSVGSRRLQDLPLADIVVSYVHPDLGRRVTDKICNVDFKNNARSLEQGAKFFETELELVCSHIEWDEAVLTGLIPKTGLAT
jgi:hypothetical protein